MADPISPEDLDEVSAHWCHAGRDGDCLWADCPQEANNRANYQSWCPLAGRDDDYE